MKKTAKPLTSEASASKTASSHKKVSKLLLHLPGNRHLLNVWHTIKYLIVSGFTKNTAKYGTLHGRTQKLGGIK